MANNVAMSTGWNAKRYDNADDIVEEIRNLGIDRLEAGYSLNLRQLNELLELLPQGRFKVDSVHNFCPTPSDHKRSWGDDFLLSSLDGDKRMAGVRSTLQTFEWAGKLGATVVVIHLGQVDMDREAYQAIKQSVADGQDSYMLGSVIAEVKKERSRLAKSHLEVVRKSLDDLVARLPKGILLGIETRSDYPEIPNLSEVGQLLDEYGNSVGYWHDTGHAHMQESMGFYEKGEYIRTLSHRLIGLHIHDSFRISDHRAPGYGEIDFESLKPYLNDRVLKVLELHSRVTPEEAAHGIEFLRSINIV